MSGNIKVALVGCGSIARHAHVPALLEHRDVVIDGLVDPDEAARRLLIERHGLRAASVPTLEELLASQKPDVVIVASPGPLHGAHAKLALQAGCHVLVEKPPADSPAEATALAELARSKQVKLGAVLNYRYRDLPMELKAHIDGGKLGAVTRIHVVHHGPLVFVDAPWLWDEPRSRYLVREFGIHFLDLMVWYLGKPAEVVTVNPIVNEATGHTTDLEATIRFESGAIGKLEIAADSTRHSSSFTHIYAYGTGMDAFVRWFPPTVRLLSGQTTPMRLISDELLAAWSVGWKLLRGTFVRHRNISHYRAIAAYLDWVRGGEPFPTRFDDIGPTLEVAEAIEARIPSYARAR